MSYWKFEKVASTSEIIQKLMAFESKYGVGAVSSIATVCSGDRKAEYYFELKNAMDTVQEKIAISSICLGDLVELPEYQMTMQERIEKQINNEWHDIIKVPHDMPPKYDRIMMEVRVRNESEPYISHRCGCYTGKEFIADHIGPLPAYYDVLAWKEIVPYNN